MNKFMLLFFLILILFLFIISQFFYIKEGFTSNINKYTRPKMRQIRIKAETFISSANSSINRAIRKIGI